MRGALHELCPEQTVALGLKGSENETNAFAAGCCWIAPDEWLHLYPRVEDKAKAHLEYRVEGDKWEQVNGKPGYYALLPLTVAGDIATSPFQLGYFLFTNDWHWTADIHGIPISLP